MDGQTASMRTTHRFLFYHGTGLGVIVCKECGSGDVRILGFCARPMVQVKLKVLDARCNQCDLISAYGWTPAATVWMETLLNSND